MNPQPTAVEAPIQLRIADDIRMRIESGELVAGAALPTLQELCEQWSCSLNSARAAIALLKQQGLISGGRGKAPRVRTPLAKVCRSSTRHQVEKDLVLAQESDRQVTGQAEIDMGTTLGELNFRATYDVIKPSEEIASVLRISTEDDVLRRVYELNDPKSKYRRAWGVSHIPHAIVASNPALLDGRNEPWPGGTQHQLYTVGIEIAEIIDHVSAAMPTTAEARLWDLDDGVPMLRVRRISVDTTGRVVEVSDADFPADRTQLSFVTPLKLWSPPTQ